MAGVDFPAEEEVLQERIASLGWAEATSVANDTFAVLRAGTESGWGVAIVCGAGINCVGVAPDGRHVRFAALGELSGDWGGGTTSAWPRCPRRRAARTDAGPRRPSSGPFRLTSG